MSNSGVKVYASEEYVQQYTEDIKNEVDKLKDNQNQSNSVFVKDIFANNELPRVYITSDKLGALSSKADGKAKGKAEIKINNQTYKCYMKGKVQGTSSASLPGKNYTIEYFADEEYSIPFTIDVGWGSQSVFCYKKNYVDSTHTRNLSGARTTYDMVASRPDSEFKSNLLNTPCHGAVDGFPCKLYINGEFWGLYTWNIPKSDWMFGMDENNPNHMVLCAEQNNNGSTVNDNVLRCEFRKEWDGSDGNSWSIEVGTYSDTLKNSFNRCVSFVMNSTDQEFHDNISDYFDLYSLLDYYCFAYLTCHYDGLGKNLIMATYDGIHWGACLYDMDSIYGATYDGKSFMATDRKCPSEYQETNSLLWQRIETCFVDELKVRYNELREGALSLGNIITHVEEIYDLIPDRVLKDDWAKWTGIPSRTTNTITRFRNYMRDRAVYVDNCINSLVKPVPCTGITLDNTSLSFLTTDTQTLIATVTPSDTTDSIVWSIDDNTIVSVENGIVTPLKNGTCTITVTCGTQSATCDVTVNEITVQYTITNNLTNVTNSNSATIIEENASYSATITANEGYTLGTIKVTMGGVDITNNVVSDGIITITSVTGDIVITATIVTEDDSVYSLAEATTFDGVDDYIDTGIQLFDTAKDFTLFIDYSPNKDVTQNDKAMIFHCIHEESPYRGLCLMLRSGKTDYTVSGQVGSTEYLKGIDLNDKKMIIEFKEGVLSSIKENYPIKSSINSTVVEKSPYAKIDETLLLGAYKTTSGTVSRFWNGTINQCKIWFRTLTNDEIRAVLNMTSITPVDGDYLANANWITGKSINSNANLGLDSSSTDVSTTIIIPQGSYKLSSPNATWKKYKILDDNSTIVTSKKGVDNSIDFTFETGDSQESYVVQISYCGGDGIEVPKLTKI